MLSDSRSSGTGLDRSPKCGPIGPAGKGFKPELWYTDAKSARELSQLLAGYSTRVLSGEEGLLAAAVARERITGNSSGGFAGLKPTLCHRCHIDIALPTRKPVARVL